MKKIFSLLGLLMLVCNSSFAAGYTRTLNDQIQVAGYKDAVLYNFQTNTPEVLPTSGDLRYREGGIWGLYNFGGGARSGVVNIPVTTGQLLIFQVYSDQSITSVSSAAANETLSSSTGYACFDVTGDAENITITVPRYSGVVAAVVMDKDNSAATAGYTVNYVSGGTVVKTVSGTEVVGTTITILGSFYEGNIKYITDAGQIASFEIESGTNTYTINVSQAPQYSYTVNAVAGSQSTNLASGTTNAGDAVSVPYPRFVNVNGTIYEAAKNSNSDYWNKTFTVSSNNYVENINYSQSATGIVFYSEAEDITGASVVTGSYANVRCSNGAGGYFTDANGGTVTTLQPGVYKLYTSTWGNSGTTITFKAGENTILEAPTMGYILDYTSEEFVISEATDIVMIGGTGEKVADFVYIQKTAEYVASESITIDDASPEIGKTTAMSATVAPANATMKTLTWKVTSGSIEGTEDETFKGQAEIDENGVLTPIRCGIVTVEASNGELTVKKNIFISAATFAATITGAPDTFTDPVQVTVDVASAANGETLYVWTKAGYDNMKNTSRLQPQGSVTSTEIPTYIYTITVDKTKKTVDVVYEKDIEVTAMEFAITDQRIALGNSRTLQVTYYPADASFKTATWESSDESVATVDPNTGLVTAVSEGTTTITATWAENASHGTDYSAQMTLTVDKGLVEDRIVYDEMDDATAEVMGYYHPMDGDTLYLPAYIESNGRMIPVSFIKQEAFIGSNLKSIIIPGTVKIIDHRALMYSNTHNAYNEEEPEEGLESAFLMEGVEVMRDRIFHGNKYMKKAYLPSTLTDIGYYSFYGTAIEDIYFGGTEEQWNALNNLEECKLPETAKIHFKSNFIAAFIKGIEVEDDNIEIAVGQEYQIEYEVVPASVAPSVALSFTSSDDEVATVDNSGVVTGIADGYAVITISAGSGVETKVRVKVGNAERSYETPLVTTWSVQGGSNEAATFVDAETHYYNNWGSQAWVAQAYAQFDLSNLQPTDDFKATFTVWVNCARGTRTFDVYGLPAGTTVADCQALTAKKGVELATYSDITTDYQAKEVDVTEYIKGLVAEGSSDAIIIMSNGAAGGYIYGKGSADYAPTLNIAPANGSEGGNQATGISEAQADKTVKSGKYVENGQIVIYIDGKKYNAAGQLVK